MAAQSAITAQHATLTTTAADLVTLGSAGTGKITGVTVYNRHATVYLYFTVGFGGAPATAVSEADETFVVPPVGASTTVLFPQNASNTVLVSVVGNANPYSVVAVRPNAIQG